MRATLHKKNVPVGHEHGPVNIALLTKSVDNSGLNLGPIKYLCMSDVSVCAEGLTISAWIKPSNPKNRESFFNTNPGTFLGVSFVSYSGQSVLRYLVQGTKHKCHESHNILLYGTWMYIASTWIIQQDGSGKLVFYLIDDLGIKRKEKVCPEEQFTFRENSGTMKTILQKSFIEPGFSLDELAVWNDTLTEDRIIELYNLVTSEWHVEGEVIFIVINAYIW